MGGDEVWKRSQVQLESELEFQLPGMIRIELNFMCSRLRVELLLPPIEVGLGDRDAVAVTVVAAVKGTVTC